MLDVRAHLFGSVVMIVACGCTPETESRTRLIGLSHDRVVVGETLYVLGEGEPPAPDADLRATFAGVYTWSDDGRPVREEVQPLTVALVPDGVVTEPGEVGRQRADVGTWLARWNRVGPFAVPFGGRGTAAGVFEGTVEVDFDGRSAVMDVALEVGPSIVLHRIAPVVAFTEEGEPLPAPCGSPALRALPGLAYVLEAEAIGLTPTSFEWQLTGINGEPGLTSFTHSAVGARDVLGAGGDSDVVVTNQLSDDVELNVMTVRVIARDAEGRRAETALPLDVVRPLQVAYDGNRVLAEYYEPAIVNGPIVGGVGTVVTYAESHTESRQRGVSVSVTRTSATSRGSASTATWNESYGITETVSTANQTAVSTSETNNTAETYGETWSQSDATQVGTSSTDGTTWGWSVVEGLTQEEYQERVDSLNRGASATVSTEVGASGSIPGFASVSGKVGSEFGVDTEVGEQVRVGSRESARTDRGTSAGGSASETQSFGSTTTDARSQAIGGSWGLARQDAISTTTSETEATAESTVFQTGGATTVNEGYTEGLAETWSETWQSTTTDTTLLSFSGKIPNGRCAVIYRQTVRHVRTAYLHEHDLCGVRDVVGELFFNEWSWSPNIAIGEDCTSSVPPSTQPPAACFFACG